MNAKPFLVALCLLTVQHGQAQIEHNVIGLDMSDKVGQEVVKWARQDRSAVAGADAQPELAGK